MLPPAPCQGDRRGRDDPAGGSALTLVLVRHTPVLVAPGICYGRLDVPLRAESAVDIAAVVAQLGGVRPDTVRTSPSSRCGVLADAIAAARGGAVVEDPRLRELDFGAWEGLAWDDVPRAALDLWAADLAGFAPPGGESGAALVARCRAAHAAVPARGCHVVVSHGGPLRVLAALAAGAEVDLGVAAQAPGEVRVFVGAAGPGGSEQG
ncbi:MAG: histidine phosphatase family protein [Janthinobacterium lividum]